MNRYFKEFLHRGLMFGGFGPVVLGIIYWILSETVADFTVSGFETFLGIVSTYILAFVQAGASVFNQIEHWSLPKSLLCHFSTLFAAYTLGYLGNNLQFGNTFYIEILNAGIQSQLNLPVGLAHSGKNNLNCRKSTL